jgi:predicted ATP-grasp superfamily ATP-dependent carboligase
LKKIFKGEKGDYIYEQRESGIYVYRVINKIKEQDITQLSKKLVKYFEEYQIHRLIQKKYQINVFDKEQYYVK